MTTKGEEARRLADAHYAVEPWMTHIFRLVGDPEAESRDEEPIKLLEVSESTVPVGIMPLGFGPMPEYGIHHRSIIVEITPEEYARIRSGDLELPRNWTIGDLYPKPAVQAGA